MGPLRERPVQGQGAKFPEDYHDYVFKDGRLIGDFDNMYRYAKDVPWSQDKRCDEWHAEVGMLMLRDRAPYDAMLEIGCGLGYIAAKLKRFVERTIDALDISHEAIKKASRLHPGIGFYVDDIRSGVFQPKREYDLVVIRDVFWYVCDRMEAVVANINACLKREGWLYVAQSFPALDRPYVGKEIIPHPDGLMAYFPNYDPVYTAVLRNHRLVEDGPILHFLGLRAR